MAIHLHSIKSCPDCGSQNIVYNEENMQVICKDCGLIYEPLEPKAEQKFEETHGSNVNLNIGQEKKQ